MNTCLDILLSVNTHWMRTLYTFLFRKVSKDILGILLYPTLIFAFEVRLASFEIDPLKADSGQDERFLSTEHSFEGDIHLKRQTRSRDGLKEHVH
ncbi:hypothetical protein TNCT_194801 [Trichonephila clavata]|uniref:Uncharacterized protein n=1 Tax=Trichonephila clavata TaxID=2740835 RepID=A0A8X6GYH1_TRICU|nr:hypothetical protein TNCT_194801 [Trichonephila clavata]